MNQEDLNRFLASVKKARLLDYLDPLPGEASAEAALERRLAWAKENRDVPEHAEEACFLLDNEDDLRELSWEEDLHTDEWLDEDPAQKSPSTGQPWSLSGDALGDFMQTDVSSVLSSEQPTPRIRATEATQVASNAEAPDVHGRPVEPIVEVPVSTSADEVEVEVEVEAEAPEEVPATPPPRLEPLTLTPAMFPRALTPQADQTGGEPTPMEGSADEEKEIEEIEEIEEAIVEEIVAEEAGAEPAEAPERASSFSRLAGWFGSWVGGTGPSREPATDAGASPTPEPAFERLGAEAKAVPPTPAPPPPPKKKKKKVEHPPFRPFEICASCGSNLLDQTAYYSAKKEWMCGTCFRRQNPSGTAPSA
jgi:hypothetical protein